MSLFSPSGFQDLFNTSSTNIGSAGSPLQAVFTDASANLITQPLALNQIFLGQTGALPLATTPSLTVGASLSKLADWPNFSIDTIQALTQTSNPTFNSLKLSGLIPSKLVYSDASDILSSVTIGSQINGSSLVFSGGILQSQNSQDLQVTATPTFANIIDSGLTASAGLLGSTAGKQLQSMTISNSNGCNFSVATSVLTATMTQNLTTAGSPTFANLIDSGLTASTLLWGNASKQLSSVAIGASSNGSSLSFLGGTLSSTNSQDISSTASPVWANITDSGLTANALIYGNGSKLLSSATLAGTNGASLALSSGTLTASNQQDISSSASPSFMAVTVVNSITASNQLTSKSYVDSQIALATASLSPKDSCAQITTANLTGYTYLNGTSGVGATLTAGSNNVPLVTDGRTLALNERICVNNQSTQAQNGLYLCTQASDSTHPVILTRTTDYNTPGQMAKGTYCLITGGTLYSNTMWVMNQAVTTIGTDAITFQQYTFCQAGTNLQVSGNVISTIASPIFTNVTGTLLTASQPNITGTGTLTSSVWNASIIGTQWGGTGADLHTQVSNGGICYSDASKLQILSGTATAQKPLLSGLSSAPSWASYTLPSSVTGSNLIVSSSNTSISEAGIVNSNGALLSVSSGTVSMSMSQDVSSSGTPSFSSLSLLTTGQNLTLDTSSTTTLGGILMKLNGINKYSLLYDTTNGFQIKDLINNSEWLYQGGTVKGAISTLHNQLDDGGGYMFITASGTGTNTNCPLILSTASSGSGTYMQVRTGGTTRCAIGYGSATQGIGVYDYVNNSFWLQQGGTTKNKIVTGSNSLLDDGGGNMSLTGTELDVLNTSDTTILVGTAKSSGHAGLMKWKSGTSLLQIDTWGTSSPIQIGGSSVVLGKGEFSVTAPVMTGAGNTLDDGSCNVILAGARTQPLASFTTSIYPKLYKLGGGFTQYYDYYGYLDSVSLGYDSTLDTSMAAYSGTVAVAGSGYQLNDIVTLVDPNASTLAQFQITGISNTPTLGVPTAVTLVSGGSHDEALLPINSVSTTGGHGTGTLTINVTWGQCAQSVTIGSGGSGYSVGQVLSVLGGTFSIQCQIAVTSVSSGAITGCVVYANNAYTLKPTNPCSLSVGSATVNLSSWGASMPFLQGGDGNSGFSAIRKDFRRMAFYVDQGTNLQTPMTRTTFLAKEVMHLDANNLYWQYNGTKGLNLTSSGILTSKNNTLDSNGDITATGNLTASTLISTNSTEATLTCNTAAPGTAAAVILQLASSNKMSMTWSSAVGCSISDLATSTTWLSQNGTGIAGYIQTKNGNILDDGGTSGNMATLGGIFSGSYLCVKYNKGLFWNAGGIGATNYFSILSSTLGGLTFTDQVTSATCFTIQSTNNNIIMASAGDTDEILRLRRGAYTSNYTCRVRFVDDNPSSKYWELGTDIAGAKNNDLYFYQQGTGGAARVLSLGYDKAKNSYTAGGAVSTQGSTLDDGSSNMTLGGWFANKTTVTNGGTGSYTVTASSIVGGIVVTPVTSSAMTWTTDTGTNIYTQMGSPPTGTTLACLWSNNNNSAGAVMTIAFGTGVTGNLRSNTLNNNSSMLIYFRVTGTNTITCYS